MEVLASPELERNSSAQVEADPGKLVKVELQEGKLVAINPKIAEKK